MTLILLGLLAAAATAWVLQPVFGSAPAGEAAALDPVALRLVERREQLLVALAELDFERDAGKLSPDEHRSLRERLMVETAEVTRALDARREGSASAANRDAPSDGAPA